MMKIIPNERSPRYASVCIEYKKKTLRSSSLYASDMSKTRGWA